MVSQRISYNTRYFSGNYAVIIAALAVYALLTNLFLVFGLLFFVGGFAAINKFGADPLQVGDHVVTQKSLYIGLFVVGTHSLPSIPYDNRLDIPPFAGIPLLYLGAPLSTFFWLVGASSVLILGHASMIEPGVESEYGAVEEQV